MMKFVSLEYFGFSGASSAVRFGQSAFLAESSAFLRRKLTLFVACGTLAILLTNAAFAQSKTEIEEKVRAAVNADLEAHELKIKSLEAELERAKAMLKSKRANMESIVKNRVSALAAETGGTGGGASDVAASDIEKASELGTKAWALWRAQKLDEARVKFEEAVKLNPNDTNLWNGLGWTQLNSGDARPALETFQKIIAIEANHPAAKNGVGQAYLALGKYDLASKVFLEATKEYIAANGEAEATNAACWYGLVNAYVGKKDKTNAIQWAEKFLKYKPDEPMMKELYQQAKKL